MKGLLRMSNRYFSAKKTLLYDFHVQNKAKMVEFAGYHMPLQYSQGIIKEHLHCREQASLFDVSHMGQFEISGPDSLKLLQRTTVGSTERMSKNGINEAYLTLFLNENAGIIDDAIISLDQEKKNIRIVCNAGNKMNVLQHFIQVAKTQLYDVKVNLQENLQLLALQGPMAASVLQKLTDKIDLEQVPFMSVFNMKVKGFEYIVSRSGYTGEDGFQISGNGEEILALLDLLMKDQRLKLAGLGARDSLRLEAGLCLHGHEMSPQRTPFEAGLMWTVYKKTPKNQRLSFIGEETLKSQVADNKAGIHKDRKRIGFMLDEAGIVRDGCRFYNTNGSEIGITTSGTYSPSLKKCVGMGYVDAGFLKSGTQILAELRGKKLKAKVSKMPFVPSRYYKGWKSFK